MNQEYIKIYNWWKISSSLIIFSIVCLIAYFHRHIFKEEFIFDLYGHDKRDCMEIKESVCVWIHKLHNDDFQSYGKKFSEMDKKDHWVIFILENVSGH